jgi:UDPglucose--hexose-1-phosphate uridylyltransferase
VGTTSDRGGTDDELERTTFVGPDGRHLYVYGELRGRPGADHPSAEPAALHQRLDLLTDAWVAFSPGRNVRPHASGSPAAAGGPGVSACPLCPGGPEVPFSYQAAVFDNRFPAFVEAPPPVPDDARLATSQGRCEVVLYTEQHRGSMATLTPVELARVVAIWRDRTDELWADPRHRFVMAFESRGEAVGATLSHPHGQIYAFDRVPPFIEGRLDAQLAYRAREGSCLGCQVVGSEGHGPRIVAANADFVIGVPFAARWPYEVHVRARRHGLRRLTDLTPDEQRSLAAALRQVTVRYDALFELELPYMLIVLEAPEGADDWHLAVEVYPPNRTASLLKVRASVETATGLFTNETLPEVTAGQLAALRGPTVEEHVSLRVVRATA